MAVNFTKNQDEITRAWREVIDSSNVPKWALYGYEGSTNVIRLMATGSGGLDELVEEFNCSLIQYAFCRVIDDLSGLNRLVLINWQGDSAPLSRKGLCASHVGDVSNYFKGCAQTITIRNDDEATKEHLMEQILKTSASKLGLSRISSQLTTPTTTTTTTTTATNDNRTTNTNSPNETNDGGSPDTVVSSSTTASTTPSSVYKKVDIGSDITASRKTFWQRQEEEEKERLAEEKRRAAEKQAQFEKERKQREELEAKKLAETIRQREQLIEATKKADKQSASANQPSSVVSTTTTDLSDDDGRVGRRSELIRLERNQETQSLITKGLIKNKRAIFEQAQQQQQQQQPTLSRRSSGAIITKRVNAFKSLDVSTNSNSSGTNDGSATTVGKLSDSFAKQANINGDQSTKSSPVTDQSSGQITNKDTTPVKSEVEAVTLIRESESVRTSSESSGVVSSTVEATNLDTSSKDVSSESQTQQPNGAEKTAEPGQDVNGNSENSLSMKSPTKETMEQTSDDLITNEELIMNGKNSNIKAIALYDYQAADSTEISFDPDDQIGHIQKVDSGWWHGQVLSGTYKGQIGLFPANYVQELQDNYDNSASEL